MVTDLKETDRDELIELLTRYYSMMTTGEAIGTVNTGSLSIRLKEDAIIKYLPYRLVPIERERLREIIQDLLDKKVIRNSNSPYASPVLLVQKPHC